MCDCCKLERLSRLLKKKILLSGHKCIEFKFTNVIEFKLLLLPLHSCIPTCNNSEKTNTMLSVVTRIFLRKMLSPDLI
jgi:hypothetical protein